MTFLGEREYSMRVWLNPETMASRGLTAGDVAQAIREQNVLVAAGQIGQPPLGTELPFQYTMSAQGRLLDEDQFKDIIVKTGKKGEITRLGDVARVELGAKSADIASTLEARQAECDAGRLLSCPARTP